MLLAVVIMGLVVGPSTSTILFSSMPDGRISLNTFLKSNRQILQRIDRHERIVVGRTGKARKFHYYCYKGGKKDDIGRIKA